MELGHLLNRSGLTYPEASSKVYHDSFCPLESSVSLPWVVSIQNSCMLFKTAKKQDGYLSYFFNLFELKYRPTILCSWFRASLIYINNCPTRCKTKQSIYYSVSSLYIFRVSTTSIIRSTQNSNYSLRNWSYFLCSYLPPTWSS